VIEFLDPLGELAGQHVGQMPRAEALPGAVHAGQRHLRGLGGIPGVHRLQAVVAFIAVARMFFAEIAQHGLVAAGGGFAVTEQRVQLLPLQPLAFLGGVAAVDHLAHLHHIAQAVGQPSVGGQAVAPGAAGFLIVAFHALGQVEMGDEAHVGFVDAHAERHGGDHHHAFFAQKAALVFAARRGIQPGVIGQRVPAALFQPDGSFLDFLARQAIDDARIVRMFSFKKRL